MLKTGVTKYGLVSADFIQDHVILFNFRNLKTDRRMLPVRNCFQESKIIITVNIPLCIFVKALF